MKSRLYNLLPYGLMLFAGVAMMCAPLLLGWVQKHEWDRLAKKAASEPELGLDEIKTIPALHEMKIEGSYDAYNVIRVWGRTVIYLHLNSESYQFAKQYENQLVGVVCKY